MSDKERVSIRDVRHEEILSKADDEQGVLIEAVYDPAAPSGQGYGFRVFRDGKFEPDLRQKIHVLNGHYDWKGERELSKQHSCILEPPPGLVTPISKDQIVLPSEPMEYGDDSQLIKDIESFLYTYNDIPDFEIQFHARYILMTWVFDKFFSVPYLEAQGEPGSGKSRKMKTVSGLCYKAVRITGHTTTAAMYRLIEATQGTFSLDEASTLSGDMRTAVAGVLNAGYASDGCITLNETDPETKKWVTQFLSVYGPKLFGSREPFKDIATQDRTFTFVHKKKSIRKDIPRQLPLSVKEEMRTLRNKLLMWRAMNRSSIVIDQDPLVHLNPPRLAEIAIPIYAVSDPEFRKTFLAWLRKQSTERQSMGAEAVVLSVLMEFYGVRDKPMLVFPGDISKYVEANAVQLGVEPKDFNPHRVGNLLTGLGFAPLPRTTKGYPRQIDNGSLDEIAARMNIQLHDPEHAHTGGTRAKLKQNVDGSTTMYA